MNAQQYEAGAGGASRGWRAVHVRARAVGERALAVARARGGRHAADGARRRVLVVVGGAGVPGVPLAYPRLLGILVKLFSSCLYNTTPRSWRLQRQRLQQRQRVWHDLFFLSRWAPFLE